MGTTLPYAVSTLGQHPHAAAQPLGPPGHAEHAQTKRTTLSCFDHGCCSLVMLNRDAIDLHDIVCSLETTATSGTVGHAALHHQGAVSHNGEAKSTIRAGGDVNLRTKKGKSWRSVQTKKLQPVVR